jgi:hypothetical protein
MRALLGVSVALLLAGTARAQSYDPIRSDLPLLITNENPDVYPRNFEDKKDFGSLFLPIGGDWACRQGKEDAANGCSDAWLTIRQDGLFHPKYMVWWTSDRPAAGASTPRQLEIGFAAKLGEVEGVEGKVELYDLQLGMRSGSEHLLFAWYFGGGKVERMEMLDVRCHDHIGPGLQWRQRNADVWLTGYCAVDSIETLKRLAKDAAKRRPIAILTRAPSRKGED